jgi:DNA-binding response OmpR family regulator
MGQLLLSRRVLIVDDNRDAADLIAEFLELSGHATTLAYDGRAALTMACHFKPDVILLDLGLPDLDGFQVAAALRELREFAGTRVVALTAWGDPATRARTALAGFDMHLVKPASFDMILNAIQG